MDAAWDRNDLAATQPFIQNHKAGPMLERLKKLLDQLFAPRQPLPAPVPVRVPRRAR